jgi:hypothetical protein
MRSAPSRDPRGDHARRVRTLLVQEIVLFEMIGSALPAARRTVWDAVVGAWQARRFAQFDDAMAALAEPIAAAACDRESLPEAGTARCAARNRQHARS